MVDVCWGDGQRCASVCVVCERESLVRESTTASNIPSIPCLTQQGININAQPQCMCSSTLFPVFSCHHLGKTRPNIAKSGRCEVLRTIWNQYGL